MSTELATAPEITDIQIQRESAAFEMLQRQAKMFASSSLVPKDFQGNLANCAIGVNIAKRLGADPFMVLQNIDIIHGRPSFRATFLIAMVNASGRFDPLQFRVEGEGIKRSCVAWTRAKGGTEILEGPPVSMEMAKAEGWSTKTGSKWQTMPELMLRYRAAAFFARLYAPDITLGMMTAEEVADLAPVRDVTPTAARVPLFAPKEEPAPEPEAPAIDHLKELKALLKTARMTEGDFLEAAEKGGLFLDASVPLDDQPADVLADLLSSFEAIVKGGAP